MAKKNKREETGGLQQPKMSVVEREDAKAEKEKDTRKKNKKEKKERKKRRGPIRMVREIFGELKKVRWPTFARTVTQTGVVLSVVIIFALVVFGIDQGLAQLYRLLTRGL